MCASSNRQGLSADVYRVNRRCSFKKSAIHLQLFPSSPARPIGLVCRRVCPRKPSAPPARESSSQDGLSNLAGSTEFTRHRLLINESHHKYTLFAAGWENFDWADTYRYHNDAQPHGVVHMRGPAVDLHHAAVMTPSEKSLIHAYICINNDNKREGCAGEL